MISLRTDFLGIAVSVLMGAGWGAGAAQAATLWPVFYQADSAGHMQQVTSVPSSEVVGNKFSTAETITFTSLGFIDIGGTVPNYIPGDGLSGSYKLGLWNAAGTLLASTTVTPSSPLFVDHNGFTTDFRYASITPVTLQANTSFTIGVLLPAGALQDSWLINTYGGNIDSPSITGPSFGYYSSSHSLTAPTTKDGYNTYDVVNALYYVGAPAPTVPEPATVAYLVLAMGCIELFRRRRSA